MWNNICRLCSSRGDYDIFSIIPSYLHASPNEFLHWQKPINKLLEETTGLLVHANDGLPQKMCALCISYLKHAATFRQQAINNAISLKAVSALSYKNEIRSADNENSFDEKSSVLITAKDLVFSSERKTDANKRINILNNQSSKVKSDEYVKKMLLVNGSTENKSKIESVEKLHRQGQGEDVLPMTYLNLLFEKGNSFARKNRRLNHTQTHRCFPENDNNLAEIFSQIRNAESDPLGEEFQTASSDENEAIEQKNNFFSYREKNFEEDDVMDLDELKSANITINIPETCKERKCRACFRRFMFEDSYKEHMDTCIEYKFLLFIEEINRLLDIRRSKAVSPHEFIRRMIFCLRKTCEWLKTSCGEIILPDLSLNGEAKNRLESDGKNSTAEISSGGNSDETIEKTTDESKAKIETKRSLFDILKDDIDPVSKSYKNLNLLRSDTQEEGRINTTTMTKSRNRKPQSNFENVLSIIDNRCDEKQISTNLLLLYEMEEDKKAKGNNSNLVDKFKSGKDVLKLSDSATKKSCLQICNLPFPFYKDKKISARCNTCMTVFDSVASLESHNANFHNSNKPDSDNDCKKDDNFAVENAGG